MRKLTLLLISFSLTLLTPPAWAKTSFSRDSHFVYMKTPVQLRFGSAQREAIEVKTRTVTEVLLQIAEKYPRLVKSAGGYQELLDATQKVNAELDAFLKYCENEFGQTAPAGLRISDAIPTGFMIFFGTEFQSNLPIARGGSVMLGMVFVPLHVVRKEIRTGKTDEYVEMDAAWVAWPTGNIGVGAGIKPPVAIRAGAGIIWGSLEAASDFQGMLVGASLSAEFAAVAGPLGSVINSLGINVKAQVLKNFRRKGVFNNFLLTFAMEKPSTVSASVEFHGNISFIFGGEKIFQLFGVDGDPANFVQP